jgi:energy-coupling factor transporter ATP-binding protein EcfA2
MHEHEARLERLEAERVEAPRAARRLRLPSTALTGAGPSRSGEIVVRAEDLTIGYRPPVHRLTESEPASPAAEPSPPTAEPSPPHPEPTVVARVPFLAAQRGERIGIVGPNGAGKTTLLRTIAGELPPLDGLLTIGLGVSIGYLAQLRAGAIAGATVVDALLEAIPITPGEARGYLARFLFRGDDVFKEVRLLSGGERSRLELALLGILPSNLLLLDEPTNHLDIPAREALETFLRETPATLLIVSHDRRLLETVCDRLWVVDAGAAAPFDGGYRAWRSAVAEGWTVAAANQAEAARLRTGGRPVGGRLIGAAGGAGADGNGSRRRAASVQAGGRRPGRAVTAGPPTGGVADVTPTGTTRARAAASSGAAIAPARPPARLPRLSKEAYRRQKAVLDAELTRLGLRKSHLELAMTDPAVAANFVELRRVSSELADVSAALEAIEQSWLELEERAP